MHETALIADLRRKLTELAGAHPDARIVGVTVSVGALAHISGPMLAARWPEILDGTGASGARLELLEGPPAGGPGAEEIRLVAVRLADGPGVGRTTTTPKPADGLAHSSSEAPCA